MLLLSGLALGFSGVLAGIYIAGVIHDHRVGKLTASQYAAMHNMRDNTFARVMPVIVLATLALALASAFAASGWGIARWLALVAGLLVGSDVVFTLMSQLPLNRIIQSWTQAGIAGDWTRIRDKWTAHHRIRTGLGVAGYILLLVAVLGSATR